MQKGRTLVGSPFFVSLDYVPDDGLEKMIICGEGACPRSAAQQPRSLQSGISEGM
jgi:hypothetical protein